MDQVLQALATRGIKCGIVTNKAGWLTEPLLAGLGLRDRFACVVSGDTLAERKPHPKPLLHAAALADVLPNACIYVGDAERDVQAARAAAMPALVANYGYLQPDEDSSAWGADGYLDKPLDLLAWIKAGGHP
jgi:phosphoglycolate phosphatase